MAIRKVIDIVYNNLFIKIFKINDKYTIDACQYFTGHIPATMIIDLKIVNFVKNICLHQFTSSGSDSLPYRISVLDKRNLVNYLEPTYK